MLIRVSGTHEYKLIDVYQQELTPTRGICIIRLNTYSVCRTIELFLILEE